MPKFTAAERNQIQSIVATLSIKRIPDVEIIEEINQKLKKTIGPRELYNVRQRIEKESYKWYTELRDDSYAYLSTYKNRIDSFFSYQNKLHEIINKSRNKPEIQIKAISELVRIEMSVYNTYKDLAGLNFNFGELDCHSKPGGVEDEDEDEDEVENSSILPKPILRLGPDYDKDNDLKQKEIVCYCEDGPGAIMCHYECTHCHNVWCPEDKSVKQEICPNPDCMFTYRDPDPIVE